MFITAKTITKLNPEHSDKFEIKILKISRHGSRSTDNAKFGHFTLLACRGRQRNVPRIITHVHSHCSAHLFFCSVTFPLPLPSWFRKLPSITTRSAASGGENVFPVTKLCLYGTCSSGEEIAFGRWGSMYFSDVCPVHHI